MGGRNVNFLLFINLSLLMAGEETVCIEINKIPKVKLQSFNLTSLMGGGENHFF